MGWRRFPTLKAAVRAFERHKLGDEADLAAQRTSVESKVGEP
jgi:hypothetical protein